jgi:hypothetical protein
MAFGPERKNPEGKHMNTYARAVARINSLEKKLRMARLHPRDPDHELDIERREELIEELEGLLASIEDVELERF